MLDRERLTTLLEKLSRRLRREGIHARLYLVGGALLALGFDRDRTTWDVDVRIETNEDKVTPAVLGIAREEGLPGTWLNEQNTPYMPTRPDTKARTVFASSSLTVIGASAEHLLAMKLHKGRAVDQDDIRVPVGKLGIGSVDEALGLHEQAYGHRRVDPDILEYIETIIGTDPRGRATGPGESLPPDAETERVTGASEGARGADREKNDGEER